MSEIVESINIPPVTLQDLLEEGITRDLVRLVQQSRKEAGLHISDHIQLSLKLPEGLEKIIKQHERYLMEQTLSDEISYQGGKLSYSESSELDGKEIIINLAKV